MTLIETLLDFFNEYGVTRTYWIAYSGGLDSHVLLSLCAELKKTLKLKLRAIHINHGLSPNADSWVSYCESKCKEYLIPFESECVHIDPSAGNTEEIARDLRYAVFSKRLARDDMLLTAHHQDDQAETMLLQMLRGAGPKGLAAMPTVKKFALGFHARPFLTVPHKVIIDYAHEKELIWIEDDSNQNTKHTRNLIRHQVLPLLKRRWPNVIKSIARSAYHCAETQALLDEYAIAEWRNCHGIDETTLSIKKLQLLSEQKQRLMLRTWFVQLGITAPSSIKLATMQNQMFNAASDKNPRVRWLHYVLRRYRDDLYVLDANDEHNIEESFVWDLQEALALPALGMLTARVTQSGGLRAGIERVTVRFRRDGEVINIPQRGSRSLKRLFQEWGIAPWKRNKIPLIYVEEKIIAIVGYFLHPDFLAKNNEVGYEIVVEKK